MSSLSECTPGDVAVKENTFIHTSYESKSLELPAGFLETTPPDAQEMVYRRLPWTEPNPNNPQNPRTFAGVIENVLSPSECAELLRLAEVSVKKAPGVSAASPWVQALVNVGPGVEVLMSHYRRSKRIIWDNEEVVNRIWKRCAQQIEMVTTMDKAVNDYLTSQTGEDDSDNSDYEEGGAKAKLKRSKKNRWTLVGLNRRMRFLKYDSGDFFAPHNDGPYREIADNGRVHLTYFTLHLYLNNSQEAIDELAAHTRESTDAVAKRTDPLLNPPETERMRGGSTAFLDKSRKIKDDVHCSTGRVLVFQHHGMLHGGSRVMAGTKYTMRCDVLYEQEPKTMC